MLRILPSLLIHFRENPHSYIAKIYGLYSFEVASSGDKFNLILMRNVNGYPTDCVERKYDLKGSTYTRITIDKNKNVPINQLKAYDTLKDLDFEKYEKKLHVPEDLKGKVYNILKSDARFLQSHSLIDYSLVVYVVNKARLDVLIQEQLKKSQNSKDSAYKVELYKDIKNQKRRSLMNQGRQSIKGSFNQSLTLQRKGSSDNETGASSKDSGDMNNSLEEIDNGNVNRDNDGSISLDVNGPQHSSSQESDGDTSTRNMILKDEEGDEQYNEFLNELESLPSTKEPFSYHIGIIDYLTYYTCKKSLEKFFKKVKKFDPNLDTSV